ncbi:alpha/beta fold hydrolase [Luteipulveratus mongoliensis]|uniref:Esterase n=1 Tax=Luteipulveratus mongoliensis TaxID=571913 RepID=A0A0K1JJD2_9MICO|nr:alpha/beta hydrolase [Luteipulveratus mongoliensis]AKU16829.1 esterase [Luteipulveratus mongoliensis]
MAEFVLVPGAWLGGWAWVDVVPELRAAGHGAHPVTLSGLAERSGEQAGQPAHVQDVLDVALPLRDVVLVGHSYAGIPVCQAAGRLGDRLRRVILVDANVPTDGQSFASGWSPRGQEMLQAALADNDGLWPPLKAGDYAGQGLTAPQIDRIVTGSTPHPGATLTEPATLSGPLSDLPVTYVKCLIDGPKPTDDVARLATSDTWQIVNLNAGHWPMLSEPLELAKILLDATT